MISMAKKINWLLLGAGVVSLSSIPATFGADAAIAGPLGAALISAALI